MPCLNEAETLGVCIEKAQLGVQRLGVYSAEVERKTLERLFNNQHVQSAEVLSESLKQRDPAVGISA